MNLLEKEIMHKVKELDCNAVYHEENNSVSVIYDGVNIAEIRSGKAEKMPKLTDEETEKFLRVRRLCRNVFDYCRAYKKGEPIKIPDFSDGYRIIYCVGSAKMAARYDRKSGFEFVVWSGNENPDFVVSCDKAREKFAVLSGLIDRDKIFDGEELEALYYCVFVTREINDALNDDMLELLAALEEKLDAAISKNPAAAERRDNFESAV